MKWLERVCVCVYKGSSSQQCLSEGDGPWAVFQAFDKRTRG